MVKFIKTILFGCETQSLIAVLTLYTGFHVFSTTILTSSPPAEETICSTLHRKWGMHSWYLLAEVKGGVLGNWPGRQWGQGRLCGGSQPCDFLWSRNAGGTYHSWWTSRLQKVMHNGETEVKVLHSVLYVCWTISIDFEAIDERQEGKPSGVSVGELYGDTRKKWQISWKWVLPR